MIGFLWAFIGAVFGAGGAWATMKGKVEKAQSDVNNIGGIARANAQKQERRWKHMIAAQIETAATLDEAREYAKLLKEDAWRD